VERVCEVCGECVWSICVEYVCGQTTPNHTILPFTRGENLADILNLKLKQKDPRIELSYWLFQFQKYENHCSLKQNQQMENCTNGSFCSKRVTWGLEISAKLSTPWVQTYVRTHRHSKGLALHVSVITPLEVTLLTPHFVIFSSVAKLYILNGNYVISTPNFLLIKYPTAYLIPLLWYYY